ncbi:condensation domain-containing protein [Dictyobacter vulcani]|uniref:condensation domain-containing protein n=1 Tax=Dictyobacter vulcani TaxID=2607529 RepID=UPI0022B835C1|nr:condensation domain-containing protein [Dictyobacter vulcani]
MVHHLAIDGVSWRILLEDMQTAYAQLAADKALALPRKTTSFQQWTAKLQAYAQQPEVQNEVAYWLKQSQAHIQPLPIDQNNGENSIASAHTVTVSLSVEETQALLHAVPPVYHTQMNDVLLTALVQTITQWTGQDAVLLHMEGHGREELFDGVDISRTVGWFTSMYPTLLEATTPSQPGPLLKAIKEQLRALPYHGIHYGLLRYLSNDEQVREQLRALPQAELSFNYLGQFDQMLATEGLFGPAGESTGLPMSPQSKRAHLLDITCSISGGQLSISLMYSRNFHRVQTINMLVQDFARNLRELIAHCATEDAGGYTPSDFSLATLTQEQIDQLAGNNREIEAIYPLSSLQQGLLFHTLYSPGDGDYVVQIGATLQGTLHCAAFKAAWQQVMDHHSILRTAFELNIVEEPQQIVYRHRQAPFFEHDWRHLMVDEQQARLATYWQEDRMQGFDIDVAPLMRFALIRLADDSYEFIWSHHHVLLDGWSMPTLLRDVFMAYEALCQHKKLQLAYVRPYQDYIQWLSQQDMGQAERFWRQMLEGFTDPTQLRIKRAPAIDEAPHYDEELLLCSEELTQQLQQFARQQQLTINTLVQGAWSLVLSHYSGRPDIVFGTTVSGRPADLAGVEAMIGLFINTLPMRVQIRPGQSILSWLHSLQAQQLEMRQYEYSPLAQVQNWSAIPRGSALFETLFVFENYPVTTQNVQVQEKSELELLSFQAQEQTNYPLTLVAHAAQQLSLKFIYDSHRVASEDIKSFLWHMQMLLHAFIHTPEQQVATVSLLTPGEQQQLQQWNMTGTDYACDANILDLFEAHVQHAPEATAVIYGEQRLSYAS